MLKAIKETLSTLARIENALHHSLHTTKPSRLQPYSTTKVLQ